MKRLLFICAYALLTLGAYAQDIIITTDARKIEAQILEVSKTEIKYKEMANLNGPTFVLETKDISSIIYSNGQVKQYHFEQNSSATTTTTSASTNGRIYRDNGQYLRNETYISSKEVERILQQESPAAYKEWKKASGLLVGGGVCIGIGGGMVLGGLFTLISQNYTACIGIECGAIFPLGIGLGLTIGSSAHYNKAIDIYNSKYDHAAVQLRWHVAPNEVGLAIAF